jgi:serine/threonine protein kinase
MSTLYQEKGKEKANDMSNYLVSHGSLRIDDDAKSGLNESAREESKNEEPADGEVSSHMVARWYRPPEIILECKHYDSKIDIWSIGCILGEMAYIWSDNFKGDSNNRFLFKGSSCYPLSPSGKSNAAEISISHNDQLIKILQTIGPQDKDNLGCY